MISFGSVFLELVFGYVPRLPGPGEEIFTDDFAVSRGGAVSSASAAAAAGASAGLCTVLGDDLGSGVVQELCTLDVSLESGRNRDVVTEVRDGVRDVEVRDLTGAGDTFAGAMIGALVQGAPLVAAGLSVLTSPVPAPDEIGSAP